MSNRIALNNDWNFAREFHRDMLSASYDVSNMELVRLPHTNVILPYHYFDESLYQFVSCYRRFIEVEKEWEGKPVLLTFEGIAHIARVYINETLVTTHYGGYTAFTVDISPYLDFSGIDDSGKNRNRNILVVEVDSRENNNLPPFGNVIDYLTYGGIYREAYLEPKDRLYLEDAFVYTEDFGAELKKLNCKTMLNQYGKESVLLKHKLYGPLQSFDTPQQEPLLIDFGETRVTEKASSFQRSLKGIQNWEIESPVLYELVLELWENGKLLDTKSIRFGFRTVEFREEGFFLNHKKVKLIGLNRHQSYPYVGYAMPKRMQRQDAEILKKELKVNAVRTSHYPQSQHFIDRCDKLGLLVFTEIPGWQHIGDQDWKEIACQNVREMILQYRNHPSVILWGVRINESRDDDTFYERTNETAHELDPTRQTGGVRYLKKSNLLEDVYTYNDFIHNGTNQGLDKKEEVAGKRVPYLVTEFNGHMYPTKAFDDEKHRCAHAMRHATVLDALFKQDNIAGGFGWCMFDYNTHKDFGSGDRICYHGVMDMFRNPKPAAYVYASQSEGEIVFDISSAMDIGDHPGGNIGEVYAVTNADSVKLYKNNSFIKEFYPSDSRFKNLPHPPILINDFIGELMKKNEGYSRKKAEAIKEVLLAVNRFGQNSLPFKYKLKMALLIISKQISMEEGIKLFTKYIGNWGGSITTYRFEAIKDNKVVKTIDRRPVGKPRILVLPDTTILREEETYDVSALRITAVDENNNRLPYYQEPVVLKAQGAIEIIGPDVISLKGGAAGVYVKTKQIKGEGWLSLSQENKEIAKIRYEVL